MNEQIPPSAEVTEFEQATADLAIQPLYISAIIRAARETRNDEASDFLPKFLATLTSDHETYQFIATAIGLGPALIPSQATTNATEA